MATTRGTPKRRFDHPVIDSDGHFVEFVPAFLDYFRAEVGKNAGDRLEAELNETFLSSNWYDQSPQERHDHFARGNTQQAGRHTHAAHDYLVSCQRPPL